MSATKYLDSTGLAYFWSKIKSALGLKADDSGVVHIAGTEIVTGTKTFSANLTIGKSAPILIQKNSSVQTTVYPSSGQQDTRINFQDKNGHQLGSVLHRIQPTNSAMYLRVFNFNRTDSENAWQDISVGFDSNGNWFTAAPTPAVADNSTKIATTKWCRTATGNFACNAATASSAAKLTTARKINGVSFDGSADVTLTAVVSSASRSADIAADGTFTVPSYIVGAQALLVYLDGCLSRQGDGWSEVGTGGTASTTIKFLQLIPKDMEIVVRVN